MDGTSNQTLSAYHSATCFLNSLFREWNQYSLVDSPQEFDCEQSSRLSFQIDLNESQALLIPLRKFSQVGRHRYGYPFYSVRNGHLAKIEFSEFVEKLTDHLSRNFSVENAEIYRFRSRVKNSRENIEKCL